MRQFRKFCETHGTSALPSSKPTLAHFAAHLSLKGLSPSTINSYLAAVRTRHRQVGLPDPGHRNHILSLAKRGAARAHHPTQRPREPITLPILHRMLRVLKSCRGISRPNQTMLRAAFCLAFHGFLRVSEYTIPTARAFDSRRHATHEDIEWHKRWFTFTLKVSKTDQLGRGTRIHLQRTRRLTCPHTAMKRYRHQRHGAPPASPLFTFRDGTPLTPPSCRHHLRKLLAHAGYRPERFNTHSFRIGAATSAAAAGATSREIKRRGRWRSRAVKAYIRT